MGVQLGRLEFTSLGSVDDRARTWRKLECAQGGRTEIKNSSHDVANSTPWDDPSVDAWNLLRTVAVDNRRITWPRD